jgi:cytidine deaminase
MSRRCSFCREYGHNIKRCHSPNLITLNSDLRNIAFQINYENPTTYFVKFHNYLTRRYNILPLKVFMMNQGISRNLLTNQLIVIHQVIKHYYSPESTLPDYYAEFNRHTTIFQHYELEQEQELAQVSLAQELAQEELAQEELAQPADFNESVNDLPISLYLNAIHELAAIDNRDDRYSRLVSILNNLQMQRNILEIQHSRLSSTTSYIKPNIILCLEVETNTTNFECCICYESYNISNLINFKCNHGVCKDCCIKVIDKTKSYNNCPLCREIITELKVNNSIVENEMNAEFVN